MSIINQPFQGQLGDMLINELNNNYLSFTIFSAFAKNSGVLRLKRALEEHRSRGGKVNAFIGIDLDGTSYEALLNLFPLCDNLFVIHSESLSTTYHSKIYLLENNSMAWCAIGSNNLTGGGLWTNFESCNIEKYSMPADLPKLQNIYDIIEKYMDVTYECSMKIKTIDDIDNLLEANYISKEALQRVETMSRRIGAKSRQKKITLFGAEKVSIPSITVEQMFSEKKNKQVVPFMDITITDTNSQKPAFINEQFWFEMRESTGGSRNILDLSKVGKIESGSVEGTLYEYQEDSTKMYGGIKFFGIDPDNINCKKNITINFQGKDYFPSTIKFAPANGSWRIQLKGASSDGIAKLSQFGKRGDFVHKILVFEKINPDYYVLSLLDEKNLQKIKELSRVWARNGSGTSSKAYGMF